MNRRGFLAGIGAAVSAFVARRLYPPTDSRHPALTWAELDKIARGYGIIHRKDALALFEIDPESLYVHDIDHDEQFLRWRMDWPLTVKFDNETIARLTRTTYL
jgi:hypothetical protein